VVSRWWGASARQGERIGAGVRGWGQVELRMMGRIASESYGCDDGAMRMREGSICGRGAGCASARGKQPSDGILSQRTSERQHVL
jgi:hypothetical protein